MFYTAIQAYFNHQNVHQNCMAIFDEIVYAYMKGAKTITPKTIRYTATLPYSYIDELKELVREKIIPSVNFAINEAVDEYLKDRKAAQYETSLKEAGKDKAFMTRTMSCAEDFSAVDGEVSGAW